MGQAKRSAPAVCAVALYPSRPFSHSRAASGCREACGCVVVAVIICTAARSLSENYRPRRVVRWKRRNRCKKRERREVEDFIRRDCSDGVVAVRECLSEPRELQLHEEVGCRPVQQRSQQLDELWKRRAPIRVTVEAGLDRRSQNAAVALPARDAPLARAAQDRPGRRGGGCSVLAARAARLTAAVAASSTAEGRLCDGDCHVHVVERPRRSCADVFRAADERVWPRGRRGCRRDAWATGGVLPLQPFGLPPQRETKHVRRILRPAPGQHRVTTTATAFLVVLVK